MRMDALFASVQQVQEEKRGIAHEKKLAALENAQKAEQEEARLQKELEGAAVARGTQADSQPELRYVSDL